MDKRVYSIVSIYALSHLFVDAICIGVIFSLNAFNNLSTSEYLDLIVIYNVIAFGSQPIIGYICDVLKKAREFSIVGMLLTIIGAVFLKTPLICVIILGIGNGFFHVGGGIVSLCISENKATLPGLFVAPGAIGVFIGGYIRSQKAGLIIVAIMLMVMIFIVSRKNVDFISMSNNDEPKVDLKWGLAIIALLLVICVRSLIGGGIVFKWNVTTTSKCMVLGAVVLGKSLGGILGDRYGFKIIGIGGLVLSAPLLSLGMKTWYLSLLGLMVFNFTMPITVTLLGFAFKKYKGFAFGLTTLALVVGYLFNYVNVNYYSGNGLIVLTLILLSSLLLYIGINGIINYIQIDRSKSNV